MKCENYTAFAMMASAFFLPISASLQSIFFILTFILILLTPNFRAKMISLLPKNWCMSALGLFFLSFIACFWTQASMQDALIVVGKYSKLLSLPLLVIGFQHKQTRIFVIHAFLLAMWVTCVISCLKAAGVVHYHGDDPGFVFRNHIITGYMMAFAAYLSALYAMQTQLKLRWLYLALALLFSYQVLFINMGRTSYVNYLLLLLLFMVQTFSWRKALLAILVALSVFGMIYHQSAIMQARAHEAINDWRHYHENSVKDTPVGFRLQFHDYARTLFHRRPFLGYGTGGFSHAFKQDQPVPGWGETLFEPHSQYWLIAVDWGILGLMCFMGFFVSLFLTSWRHHETRCIAIGLIFTFLLGCALDSLLLYSVTGYFFLLFTALCLAGSPESAPAIRVSSLSRAML